MSRGLPVIETERLVLRLPGANDAAKMHAYQVDNRAFHGPWNPRYPEKFYTVEFWEERLALNQVEYEEDRSLRLAMYEPGGAIIGTLNFNNFVRGVFQACHLGYGIDRRHEGRGLMSEALRASIDFCFEELDLHRIMANYIPTNERSANLLKRLGFRVEGYAYDYLLIDGQWRDHVLTALVRPADNPTRS